MKIDGMRWTSPAALAQAAAATLSVALVGGAIVDRLWLALVPATMLIFLAVGALQPTRDGRDERLGTIGGAALRLGCVGLLATYVAGLVVVAVRGVEPAWLSVAALVSGLTFLIGEVFFGIAAARRRTAPRGAAILFAVAIPLGVAIDVLPSLVVPIPLFITGAGVYIGLGLLALSISRLGRAAPRSRATGDAAARRPVAAAAGP